MRWPWQRRHAEAGDAGGTGDTGEPTPAAVQRPRGQWRGVEPLQPVGRGASCPPPSRWSSSARCRPGGRCRRPWSRSVTRSRCRRRPGRCPSPVCRSPGTRTRPSWCGRPCPRSPPSTPPTPRGAARPRASSRWRRSRRRWPRLAGRASPRPLPASRSTPADVPEQAAAEPQVRDLVGDQDPLPLQRSRRPEAEATPLVAPAAATPSDDAAGPADLPLRRAVPTAQEVVAARAETPQLLAPAVTGPGRADGDVVAPLPELRRADVVDLAGPQAAASPVPPEAPAPVDAPAPVRAETVPAATVRTVRPVVGRRRALVDAPSLGARAEPAPDLADARQAAEPEPQPSYDRPPAPGLGVPDWFSSGPLRPPAPDPDPVPGGVQRPAARAAAPPRAQVGRAPRRARRRPGPCRRRGPGPAGRARSAPRRLAPRPGRRGAGGRRAGRAGRRDRRRGPRRPAGDRRRGRTAAGRRPGRAAGGAGLAGRASSRPAGRLRP